MSHLVVNSSQSSHQRCFPYKFCWSSLQSIVKGLRPSIASQTTPGFPPSWICFPKSQPQPMQDKALHQHFQIPSTYFSIHTLSQCSSQEEQIASSIFFYSESNFTQLWKAKQGLHLLLRNNYSFFEPKLIHQLLQSWIQSWISSQKSEIVLSPPTFPRVPGLCTDPAQAMAPFQLYHLVHNYGEEINSPSLGHLHVSVLGLSELHKGFSPCYTSARLT